MNLNITGVHLEVTSSLRDYLTEKLDRVTRHVDNVIAVNVALSVDKLDQKVAVDVHLKGKDIHVEIIPQGLNVLVPKNPTKKNPLEPLEILLSVLRS